MKVNKYHNIAYVFIFAAISCLTVRLKGV